MSICVHAFSGRLLVQILDKAEVQRSTTILVPLEFRDCRLCSFAFVESDDARASRSAARLVLDLSLLNFANSCEKFNQIFVTC